MSLNNPELRLDAWTICFFVVSLLGLIISCFLFLKRVSNRWPYFLLATYTMILSYQIFESALFWSNLIYKWTCFYNISASADLLASPILYLFYKTLFDFRELKKSSLLHFLPFLIITVLNIPYYSLDIESKRLFLSQEEGIYKHFFTTLPILISIQMLVYLIISFRTIKSQNSIGSVKILSGIHLSLYALVFISNAIYYYISFFTSLSNPFIDFNVTILLSFVVLLSGWFGVISPEVFNGSSIKDALISRQTYTMSYDFKYNFLETYRQNSKSIKPIQNRFDSNIIVRTSFGNDANPKGNLRTNEIAVKVEHTKYKNSGLTISAADELKILLDNLMSDTKAYRENNIALESLATKLNTTRHNLSQVINEKYKLNFFDYINMLRINEAKELLCDKKNQKMQIIDIAYSVGYNNKVTFNNAFKKFTGLTPSQYKTQNIIE